MLTFQLNLGTSYLAQLVSLIWIFVNFVLLVGFTLCGVQISSAFLGVDILHPHIGCEVVIVCALPRAGQLQIQASNPSTHMA